MESNHVICDNTKEYILKGRHGGLNRESRNEIGKDRVVVCRILAQEDWASHGKLHKFALGGSHHTGDSNDQQSSKGAVGILLTGGNNAGLVKPGLLHGGE